MNFLLLIFLLFLMYSVLIIQGRTGIDVFFIMLGAKQRRPIDISHLQIIPSNKLQSTIDKLSKLGFISLGQVRVNIRGVQSADGWVFISPDKLTHAEATEVMIDLVIFTTVYFDNAVIETGFPTGERIETDTFRSHTITSDVEKAYHHHTQQIEDFNKLHGIPRKTETMHDYLYWDIMYREKYIWKKSSRHIWISSVKILAFVYSFVVTLIFVSSWLQLDTAIAQLDQQLLLLMKIIAPAVLIAVISPYIALWSGHREMKPA
jgi:hypothetical protein